MAAAIGIALLLLIGSAALPAAILRRWIPFEKGAIGALTPAACAAGFL